MNPKEIEAFLDSPGPDGVYRWELGEIVRYRKYHDGVWYLGWSESDFRPPDALQKCVNASLHESMSGRGIARDWAMRGALISYFCDLSGHIPRVQPEQEQLDLFI